MDDRHLGGAENLDAFFALQQARVRGNLNKLSRRSRQAGNARRRERLEEMEWDMRAGSIPANSHMGGRCADLDEIDSRGSLRWTGWKST